MREHSLKFETFAVGAIALFSGLFFLQTYQYGRRAALFPRVVSLTILFLTGVFIVSRIRRAMVKPPSKKETASVVQSEISQARGVNWLLTLSAATGYCALIYLIGFGPATFFYVVTHLYLAGYPRRTVTFLFALAMAIIIVVTGYLFTVPLPEGLLMEMLFGTR